MHALPDKARPVTWLSRFETNPAALTVCGEPPVASDSRWRGWALWLPRRLFWTLFIRSSAIGTGPISAIGCHYPSPNFTITPVSTGARSDTTGSGLVFMQPTGWRITRRLSATCHLWFDSFLQNWPAAFARLWLARGVLIIFIVGRLLITILLHLILSKIKIITSK